MNDDQVVHQENCFGFEHHIQDIHKAITDAMWCRCKDCREQKGVSDNGTYITTSLYDPMDKTLPQSILCPVCHEEKACYFGLNIYDPEKSVSYCKGCAYRFAPDLVDVIDGPARITSDGRIQ